MKSGKGGEQTEETAYFIRVFLLKELGLYVSQGSHK